MGAMLPIEGPPRAALTSRVPHLARVWVTDVQGPQVLRKARCCPQDRNSAGGLGGHSARGRLENTRLLETSAAGFLGPGSPSLRLEGVLSPGPGPLLPGAWHVARGQPPALNPSPLGSHSLDWCHRLGDNDSPGARSRGVRGTSQSERDGGGGPRSPETLTSRRDVHEPPEVGAEWASAALPAQCPLVRPAQHPGAGRGWQAWAPVAALGVHLAWARQRCLPGRGVLRARLRVQRLSPS